MTQVYQCPDCQRRWQHTPLTKRQLEVLTYIRQSIGERGLAPTFQEIADQFGLVSLATVYEHIDNLQRKGWVTRRPNEARTLMLVEAPE